jgi:predicted HicB family RNase H-like nuclease
MDDRFDGFTVNLAHFVELPNISAFGPTPEAALNELASAWEMVKRTCVDDGRPVPMAPTRKEYSGQFNVRIDRRLRRALAIEAARAGVSLNALVSQKLAQNVYP